MSDITRHRLFDTRSALHDPFAMGVVLAIATLLAVAPLAFVLVARGEPAATLGLKKDLWDRWRSWLVLAPLIAVPVLLGGFYAILAVGALSLLCYREYARATGLFRERTISVVVVLGITGVTFATLDNWYGLFVAMFSLSAGCIAVAGIFPDRPQGYVQRVGLGVMAFMLFGACLGHLGYFCNDGNYREIILWIVVCTEMNDIFAYTCGKSFGRRKIAPNTSPNKTVGGSLGALVLTTTLAVCLGRIVFRHTLLAEWPHLLVMGLMISALGQLGDLLLSSVKRDVGIKDIGTTFPGHGGFLDRFNSLLLVSPALFHYVGYYLGVGLDQPARIFTGP